jgi:tetratricopeptide (TPR) repeat protein
MSVFRGGFSYQAAQAVTGTSLHELRALVNKSRLRRLETGRYELHELLRQYGAEKLAQTPTAEATTHDRHSAYYCSFVQAREADLKGARQHLALAELRADRENIRLAWTWAAQQRQVERLAQAMDGLGLFYDWRGHFQEGKSAFQMAAEKLTPSAETLPLLAHLFTWQALFCRRLGQTEQARQLFHQSLSCLDNPELAGQDTRSEKAFVLFQLGDIMIDIDRSEASPLLEQSLLLYRTLRDRWTTSHVLRSLGNMAWELSEYEEARQRLQEGLALQEELGDQRSMAEILTSLGRVARHQGQLEEAEQLQRQSFRLIEKMADRAGLAQIHKDLAISLNWLGRFSEGVLQFEEGLTIYKDLGHLHGLADSNISLAEATQHLGWYDQAYTYSQMALTLRLNTGDQRGIGFASLHLGEIALAREAYPEAQQWLQDGSVILHQLKQRVAFGVSLATLGGVATQTHQFQQAVEYLVEPLRIALQTRAFFLVHVALAFVALFLTKQGQSERAIEIYTVALRFPYIGNSRWFEDVAGRRIAAAALALPPEVVAAAQARGKARDLWVTAAELLAELEANRSH